MTTRPIINPQPLPAPDAPPASLRPTIIAFVGRTGTVARAVGYLFNDGEHADQPEAMAKMRAAYGFPIPQRAAVRLDLSDAARDMLRTLTRFTTPDPDAPDPDAHDIGIDRKVLCIREAIDAIEPLALANATSVQAVNLRGLARDVYVTGIKTPDEARRLRDVAGALVVYVVSEFDTRGSTHGKTNPLDRSGAEGLFDVPSPFVDCEFDDPQPDPDTGEVDWQKAKEIGWPYFYSDVVDVVLTGNGWVDDVGYINALARSGAFNDLAASSGAIAAPYMAKQTRRG